MKLGSLITLLAVLLGIASHAQTSQAHYPWDTVAVLPPAPPAKTIKQPVMKKSVKSGKSAATSPLAAPVQPSTSSYPWETETAPPPAPPVKTAKQPVTKKSSKSAKVAAAPPAPPAKERSASLYPWETETAPPAAPPAVTTTKKSSKSAKTPAAQFAPPAQPVQQSASSYPWETETTPSAANNNKECTTCNAVPGGPQENRQNLEDIVNKAAGSWLDASISAETLYNEIKNKYLNSPKCHAYGMLSAKDQKVLMLKMYSEQLRAFRDPVAVNGKTLSPTEALESILDAMGEDYTSPIRTTWTARLNSLPANDKARASFQVDLLKLMSDAADRNPQFRQNALAAANEVFKANDVPDCDFPSKEAFVEGVNEVRRHSNIRVAKRGIFTLTDRSMPKRGNRLMTFDMNSKEVLFRSAVAFGDANANSAKVGPEADVCSNTGRLNASPYGLALTSNSRPAANGAFKMGTYLGTLSANSNTPNGSRGVAVHESGSDPLRFFYDPQNSPSVLYDRILKTSNSDDLTLFLRTGVVDSGTAGMTDGCVGVPRETVSTVQKIIENGSYIYFYCPPNMRK